MGTNGVQEPATGFENGKLVGTKRLFADGKFGTKDGKATFMATQWRGFEAPGKEEESKKFAFLINNGRANHVWQSAYLDQEKTSSWIAGPYPYIQMNPEDMKDLGLSAGDLVEVHNDNGATQAMAYPTPTARRKQTFMLFALPDGRAGKRRLARRQRTDHSQLQADVGGHSQDRLGARSRARHELQVLGISRSDEFGIGSTSARATQRPGWLRVRRSRRRPAALGGCACNSKRRTTSGRE